MNLITIQDKTFKLYISEKNIQEKVKYIAYQINSIIQEPEIIALVVLNGAFIFASDLLKILKQDIEVAFVKLQSYKDMHSTGKVDVIIDIPQNITNKHILIIEDIIDTGLTMQTLKKMIMDKNPASLRICSFLVKPEVFKNKFLVDFVGYEIPNKFVVGYGLDYNQKGRHYPHIYEYIQ